MSEGLGFWEQIDKALGYLEGDDVRTFDDVKHVLDVFGDPDNIGSHGPDETFFAGGGGEGRVMDALEEGGWRILWTRAWYHYAARHPQTNETLTYIEGDIYRGNRMVA